MPGIQKGKCKQIWLLLAILLLFLKPTSSAASLLLTVATPTINTNSLYTFQIVDDNLKLFSGTIKITFPTPDYSISSITSIYESSNSAATYSFSIASSSIVSITYTQGSSKILSITINSVRNPGSVKSVQIQYSFISGSSTVSTALETFSSFSTDVLSSCSLTFSPSTTHTAGTATLTVTVKNGVNAGGSVAIAFPSSWKNPATSNYSPILAETTACTKVTGFLTSPMTCDIVGSSVSASSIFSAAITAGTSFSFSFTNIRSPPTTSTANVITVTTSTSTSDPVDSSTACSVVAVSGQSLAVSTSSSFTVGSESELKLSFTTNSPLAVGDIITITLPTSYMSFSSTSTTPFIEAGSIIVFTTASSPSNLIRRFTINSLGSATEITESSLLSISQIWATCLLDTSSRSISVQITRNGFVISSGTITITPSPAALTAVSIVADIPTVSSSMQLSISFTLTNTLQTTGSLKVQIPSALQLTGSPPICTVTSTNHPEALLSSSTCSLSAFILSVSAFMSSNLPASTALKLTISSALQNPMTTQPTNVFLISTLSSAAKTIDLNSAVTYTASAGTIGSLTVVPASGVVGATTVYTIVYTFTRKIKSGSSVSVVVPAEISLVVSPSYTYQINNSGSPSSISPALTTNGNGTKTLLFSGMIASDLASGTILKILITSLINPLSLKPSSSFQVSTSSSTYLTESISSGLSITNSQVTTLVEVLQAVFEPTNGESSSYNFYIKPRVALQVGDQIIIDIVSTTSGFNQLTFVSPIDGCRIFYNTVTLTNTCSLSNNRLTVTLTGALSDTTGIISYQLVIEKIKMARTMSATSSFTISTYTADGFGISSNTVVGKVTELPNQLQSLSLSIANNPSQLNQAQEFTITFTTFNGLYLLQGDYIVISIPNSYTYIGGDSPAQICISSSFQCSFYNSDKHSIKVVNSASFTSSSLKTSFSVTLSSLLYKSPTTFSYTSDFFFINTYTSSASIIDETSSALTPATFYRTCSGFCKTCLSSNTSSCQTCYTVEGSLTYDGYNYLTSDNICVDVCGDNYYNNSGVCTPCDSPCYGCESNELDCTSCVDGFFFDSTEAVNIKCKVTCPDSYYGDESTNICKLCSATCLTCQTTSIICTSCDNGTYLYINECRTSCPTDFYDDPSTNKCVPCHVSCIDCTTSTTACVDCETGYYRSGDTCVSDCPSGTANNTETGLCECADECASCEGTLDTCLTCSNNSHVLFDSTCLSVCPSGSYLPTSSGDLVCESCLFSFCEKCDNTSCLICQSGYFLHLGSCVVTCPAGYFESSLNFSKCEDCGDGCSSCEDSNECLSCSSPYLQQEVQCVTTCSASYINFNATECLSQCPIGYYNSSGKCEVNPTDETTTPTTATETVTVTASTGRVIPFPYTIAYILMFSVCIGLKCLYPFTLLPSAVMSFGSLLEVLSGITLVIASFVQFERLTGGAAVVLVVLLIGYICNIICLVFIVKVLNNDLKFLSTYKKTVCGNIIIRCISLVFSHKFHESVFSNIFGARVFSNKVQYVKKLTPFNILLIVSILGSLVCIGGAGVLSYSVQSEKLSSPSFVWSIDCIVVWILNIIVTILVLRRKESDYEKDVDEDNAKRYATQDELKFNNDSGEIDQVFMEQSGVRYANQSKAGQSRKNYFYANSRVSGAGEDPYETPLHRKNVNRKNPMNSSRDRNNQESSEALCIGDKNKSKKKIDEDSNEDIEEIMLQEPVRDNLAYVGKPGQRESPGKNQKLNYEGYDLDPQLLVISENSEEFKKLPAETKAKIRLAKANQQINKNSKNIGKSNETLDPDLDEIQLSPKKKTNKGDGFSADEEGESANSANARSKSKSKSKEKEKNRSKSKSIDKNNKKSPRKGDIDLEMIAVVNEQPEKKINRNKSETMKNQDLKDARGNGNGKGTKSQNVMKDKRDKNGRKTDIRVVHHGKNEKRKGSKNKSDQVRNGEDNSYEEEPSLPVFKHRKGNERNGADSDGMGMQAENEIIEKRGHGKRRSESTLEKDNPRFRDNNMIDEQDPDQLPGMHSSEQLNKLIITKNNSPKKSEHLNFSNDDQSIYKKIYNDETETLKSVQGDNYFGQDISPSQFNIQNQRFDDQDNTSNDMPVKPMLNLDYSQEGPDFQRNDGLDEGEPSRYRSGNLNIDYDLMVEKRQDNDKIKQLEEIYLPRLEVMRAPKNKRKQK